MRKASATVAKAIDMPWAPQKTRQVEGRASEVKQAKKYGARVHPNSGAGHIKDDASTEEIIYEFKDSMKTHTLKGEELEALFKRAAQQGKEARYVILFNSSNLEATITLGRP